MLNTANWDPVHVNNYVVEYMDSVDSLPFDLQRNVSVMREIDSKYQGNAHYLLFYADLCWNRSAYRTQWILQHICIDFFGERFCVVVGNVTFCQVSFNKRHAR